jgi:hypothetical protein
MPVETVISTAAVWFRQVALLLPVIVMLDILFQVVHLLPAQVEDKEAKAQAAAVDLEGMHLILVVLKVDMEEVVVQIGHH